MSDKSFWCILLNDLNLQPYKLQIVHFFGDWNKEVCLQFCRQFQGILTENPDLPNNLLMSVEANIHLHVTVNKQNIRYLSAENPHKLHHGPLYDPEVTIYCAVWSIGVIGPYFFEDEDI